MKRHKKIFLFILATLYLLLYTPLARAEGISLGINPPLLTIDANPPATIQAPITIYNKSDNTISLTLQIKAFTAAQSADGQIRLLNQDQESSLPNPKLLNQIVVVDKGRAISSLTLSPRQEKTVSLAIDIAKDEQPGDYYFSVIFSGVPDSTIPGDTSGSAVSGGIASNVLLSIGPKGQTSGLVEEFSTDFYRQTGPVPFTIKLKNTSRHIISPKGQVRITNMFGQEIGKVELLPVNILSGTSRYLPDVDQKSKAVWKERFLLGLYSAKLSLSLSDTGPSLERETRFFAFPLIFFMGLVLGIIILLVIRSKIKSRLK